MTVHFNRRVLPYLKSLLWVLPALVIYGVFRFYPFFYNVVLGFQRWDGIGEPIFIGLENYRRLFFEDAIFWQALQNNVIFAFGTVIGKMVISLFLAVLLNQSLLGSNIYRTVLFLPVVMSFVVVGLLWSWIYNFNFGLLNALLRAAGLGILAQDWLGNPDISLFSVIWVDIWKWYGFHMVIFLAGLQAIPKELFEAARIDGANSWNIFWAITLPLLRPILIINVTISLIGAFNVFDLIYVLTEGGPFNSTNVALIHMYLQGFRFHQMGYASAISNALFVIVLIVAAAQIWLMRGARYD